MLAAERRSVRRLAREVIRELHRDSAEHRSGVVHDAAKRKIEVIDELLEHVEFEGSRRIEEWEDTTALTAEELRDILPEQREFQQEIEAQATQLAVVSLYRIVEFSTKALIARCPSPPPARSLFRFAAVQSFIQDQCRVVMTQVPGFHSADEIRCLNNFIKHGGHVDRELSQYPTWKLGDELSNVGEAYARLSPHVPIYLRELASRLPI